MNAKVLSVMCGLMAGNAAADVAPFVESFDIGNAAWGDEAGAPLAWSGSGGADGGGHVSNVFNFVDASPGGFPQVLFRGQDDLGSSGGAFVGDWLAGGITELRFMVRHDAQLPLQWFARMTPAGANFPSVNAVHPDFVFGGGGDVFSAVFGNFGKLQIGVYGDELAGIDQDYTFQLDQVSTVPAPACGLLLTGLLAGRRRRR